MQYLIESQLILEYTLHRTCVGGDKGIQKMDSYSLHHQYHSSFQKYAQWWPDPNAGRFCKLRFLKVMIEVGHGKFIATAQRQGAFIKWPEIKNRMRSITYDLTVDIFFPRIRLMAAKLFTVSLCSAGILSKYNVNIQLLSAGLRRKLLHTHLFSWKCILEPSCSTKQIYSLTLLHYSFSNDSTAHIQPSFSIIFTTLW